MHDTWTKLTFAEPVSSMCFRRFNEHVFADFRWNDAINTGRSCTLRTNSAAHLSVPFVSNTRYLNFLATHCDVSRWAAGYLEADRKLAEIKRKVLVNGVKYQLQQKPYSSSVSFNGLIGYTRLGCSSNLPTEMTIISRYDSAWFGHFFDQLTSLHFAFLSKFCDIASDFREMCASKNYRSIRL